MKHTRVIIRKTAREARNSILSIHNGAIPIHNEQIRKLKLTDQKIDVIHKLYTKRMRESGRYDVPTIIRISLLSIKNVATINLIHNDIGIITEKYDAMNNFGDYEELPYNPSTGYDKLLLEYISAKLVHFGMVKQLTSNLAEELDQIIEDCPFSESEIAENLSL